MKKFLLLLLFILISLTSFSQRIISGRVSKIGGGILTAVKISAKEAPAIFTFTDDKGRYRIELPNEVKHLTFSYSEMEDKTILIGDFNNINASLTPANYKKIRFGLGLAYGTSKFKITAGTDHSNLNDSIIPMTPFSIHGDLFYRFHKRFDIQAVLEDGLNTAKIETDSSYTNIYGGIDTVSYTAKLYLNRVTSSLIVNFYLPFTESRNYSAFIGFGPQFQHLSILKTNTMGARFQIGININDHGFTSRIYLATDVSNGQFEDNNEYVAGLPYRYSSGRFGVVFIF